MAHKEPVLVLTSDGEEFILSQADDFAREVEVLRNSQTFQKFLEERPQCRGAKLNLIYFGQIKIIRRKPP